MGSAAPVPSGSSFVIRRAASTPTSMPAVADLHLRFTWRNEEALLRRAAVSAYLRAPTPSRTHSGGMCCGSSAAPVYRTSRNPQKILGWTSGILLALPLSLPLRLSLSFSLSLCPSLSLSPCLPLPLSLYIYMSHSLFLRKVPFRSPCSRRAAIGVPPCVHNLQFPARPYGQTARTLKSNWPTLESLRKPRY